MWISKIRKDKNKLGKKKNESSTSSNSTTTVTYRATQHTSLTSIEVDSDEEGDVVVQDDAYKQEGVFFNSKDTLLLSSALIPRESE